MMIIVGSLADYCCRVPNLRSFSLTIFNVRLTNINTEQQANLLFRLLILCLWERMPRRLRVHGATRTICSRPALPKIQPVF